MAERRDRTSTLPVLSLTGGEVSGTPLLTDGSVDAVAVPVGPARPGDEGLQPGEGTAEAAARYGIDLAELAERAGLTGAAGQAHTVQLPRPVGSAVSLPWDGLPSRVILVGTGSGSTGDLRRAGAALARQARGLRRVASTVGVRPADPASAAAQALRAVAEGYLLGAYPPYRAPGTSTAAPEPVGELVLLGRDGTRSGAAVAAARAVAEAVWLARDLTATPSSTKNPEWLAAQARRRGRAAGLQAEVLGPRELAAGGFGGLLAVGGGSANGPRLVRVTWDPASETKVSHVVVVGKGITFDTGGISLKPRESMVTMKTDMAGAAVALSTVLGAAALGVPHRVTAVLAIAENHLAGASYRPGDVVTIHGGHRVEVTNTDAEGRLVLADALDWAAAELAPDVLIDVATLTGAATVALGRTHAALFTADDALAAALEAAGLASGEPVWRLPLVDDYEELLSSSIADVRQISNDAHSGAGAIVAALMLRRFTRGARWAHLDIAGPARATAELHEVPVGATGYGVRLLLGLLADPSFAA
ncbi:MAG: leucyl aminopeptidase family protein [Actinobacteria bacterium]|nr:leucyl aminopeptidase family protein [Actinomycetota bacterium]MCG2799710.1 leucyl aminopeptidase family protein [Cellulomonas sp.]